MTTIVWTDCSTVGYRRSSRDQESRILFPPVNEIQVEEEPKGRGMSGSAWQQAIIAGATAAIVQHMIAWMVARKQKQQRNYSTLSVDDNAQINFTPNLLSSWEVFNWRLKLWYTEAILPTLRRFSSKAEGRLRLLQTENTSTLVTTISTWSPLLIAFLFSNRMFVVKDRTVRFPPISHWALWLGLSSTWLFLARHFSRNDSTDNQNLEDTARLANITVKERSDSTSSSKVPERYFELLVHNVSHSDILFSCCTGSPDAYAECAQPDHEGMKLSPILGRPRFSCFDLYARKALKPFTTTTTELRQPMEILHKPRYQRKLDSPRLPIEDMPTNLPTTPIGFRLANPVPIDNWRDLRVRGRDQTKLAVEECSAGGETHEEQEQQQQHPQHPKGFICDVLFPLLATLIPRWQALIEEKSYPPGKPLHRVLLLVTGVGTPRNWTHSMTGNSTEAVADLMRLFLKNVDPFLTVVHVHSPTNVFRYDENLLFVEREFLPTVEAYRDAHARGLPYPTNGIVFGQRATVPKDELHLSAARHHDSQHPFDTEWQKSFSVTLSLADGSPARTHAIQACLRPYKPTYFHIWQLKTFWHESKVVDDDIEVHTFETMDTVPPMDVTECHDPWIQATVREMKNFYMEITETRRDNFWLRKTQKPVLAVLLVQTATMQNPVLYRGTNMEVSMPTGSLCAERCVIGSALAQNPALKREDLKVIAVLAVPRLEPVPSTDAMVPSEGMGRVRSTSTLASIDDRKASFGSEQDGHSLLRKFSVASETEDLGDWVVSDTGDPPATTAPVRRIKLFSSTHVAERSSKHQTSKKVPSSKQDHRYEQQHTVGGGQKTVIIHSCKDLNPLAPCGTCNEWLKKIAEANPYFRIITFTDADCNGIYVASCQD